MRAWLDAIRCGLLRLAEDPLFTPLRPLSVLLLAAFLLIAAPLRAANEALPSQDPAGWEKEHSWLEGGVATKGATAVLLVAGVGSSVLQFRAPTTAMADALGAPGGLELGYTARTSLFPKLEAGEKRLPGLVYKSYGGHSPISVRVHVKAPGAKAHTVDLFSVPSIAEMHTGTGDAMVSDASAHFPHSYGSVPHVTQPLTHGEILWSQASIDSVRTLLSAKPAGY